MVTMTTKNPDGSAVKSYMNCQQQNRCRTLAGSMQFFCVCFTTVIIFRQSKKIGIVNTIPTSVIKGQTMTFYIILLVIVTCAVFEKKKQHNVGFLHCICVSYQGGMATFTNW
jgi:hypothetical protein